MDTDQEKRSDFAAIVSGTPNSTSAHEAARFIATVSLSLGALMLSLFGIIERMVTFEKLAMRGHHSRSGPLRDAHARRGCENERHRCIRHRANRNLGRGRALVRSRTRPSSLAPVEGRCKLVR